MDLFLIYTIALLLDLLIGDPNVSWHPVALIGRTALRLEIVCRKYLGNGFFAGMFCALAIVSGCGLIAAFLVVAVSMCGFYWELFAAGAIVYSTIAPRSLIAHTLRVSKALKRKDLAAARYAVGMITSRDPEALDENGVIRSTLETLGENVIDGITAALFWAMIGWLSYGPVGAASFAFMYRAANTLDATFGYKNDRYIYFGTFAARLDDVLNFIPARLTLIAIFFGAIIMGLRPMNAVKYAWRDRKKHPSPNSNWGMAAFAGALGVQLGGTTYYRDRVKHYDTWGKPLEPLQIKHIIQAQRLVVLTTLMFMLVCVFIGTIYLILY